MQLGDIIVPCTVGRDSWLINSDRGCICPLNVCSQPMKFPIDHPFDLIFVMHSKVYWCKGFDTRTYHVIYPCTDCVNCSELLTPLRDRALLNSSSCRSWSSPATFTNVCSNHFRILVFLLRLPTHTEVVYNIAFCRACCAMCACSGHIFACMQNLHSESAHTTQKLLEADSRAAIGVKKLEKVIRKTLYVQVAEGQR